jgi:phosphoglycolate phosphatase
MLFKKGEITTVKLLLFDIDGTLLLAGGAGLRAMSKAFEQLYGIPEAFAGINLAGRTDTAIIRNVCEQHRIPFFAEELESFKKFYYEYLETEINLPRDGKILMPGIETLLENLSHRQGIYLGLLTGNWRTSGFIKLSGMGIAHYFGIGAFADDSELRDELLPFAVERFAKEHGKTPKADEVYVIGDTPSDIQCARPHGAIAVAVGAAHYTAEQLRAYNPDYLFENLADTEAVLRVLG